jgi:tetratricopeptide (TPR) repeat protein
MLPLTAPRMVGAFFAVVMVGAVAQPAAAQFTPSAVYAEADRLHDEAIPAAIFSDAELVAAAQKHGVAATLRLPSDPRAVECHIFQANLLYLIGHYAEARQQLEHAAGIALANGEAEEAAFAYIHAATVAVEQGERAGAVRLMEQAQRLSMRNDFDGASRTRIQQLTN